MSDSVDIVESNRNRDSVEGAIQDWLDNNTVSSIDHVGKVYEMSDRVGVAIVYTS